MEFENQVEELCDLNGNAKSYLDEDNTMIISTDEKCGMQALERTSGDLPVTDKHDRKIEFNYIRHGTQTLIGGLEIATGQIYSQIGDTRTEKDYAEFIDYVVNGGTQEKELKYVFLADQLNTHKSESLVRLLARINGDTSDLGVKGKSGILKNMDTRMDYLTRTGNRVRFVYTPKHCSWLNLIESWFSQLGKRVLKSGNFTSKDDL
ncbi:MAG: transposase, partial [Saprospiraceae bacterium]